MRQRRKPVTDGVRGPRAHRATALSAGALVVLSGLAVSGCGPAGAGAKNADQTDLFTVTSPAFPTAHDIPPRFACRQYGGVGATPPLRWSEPNAAAFAIVVDDPDAPGGDYVHWVLANIDGHTTELVEGARPAGVVEGHNSAGTVGYTPPCPPRGEKPHHYRFTIYALNGKVSMKEGASLKDSLAEIASLTIGHGRITGNFGGK
jgi:Raf kinase inhibitor-like YbhB/YbcL family protein